MDSANTTIVYIHSGDYAAVPCCQSGYELIMVIVYHQFADAEAASAHAALMNSERFRAMAEEVGIVLPVEILLMTDVK